jgi:hypothetical protein
MASFSVNEELASYPFVKQARDGLFNERQMSLHATQGSHNANNSVESHIAYPQ